MLQFLRSPLLLGLMAACFVFVRVLGFGGDKKPETKDDDLFLAEAA